MKLIIINWRSTVNLKAIKFTTGIFQSLKINMFLAPSNATLTAYSSAWESYARLHVLKKSCQNRLEVVESSAPLLLSLATSLDLDQIQLIHSWRPFSQRSGHKS